MMFENQRNLRLLSEDFQNSENKIFSDCLFLTEVKNKNKTNKK
jgi:hypothetical protein